MHRPNRTTENGALEAFTDEEYIEYVAHEYEIDEIGTITDFYNVLVHDILRFHDSNLTYSQLLAKTDELSKIHNEAYKRAKSSAKDPIRFN